MFERIVTALEPFALTTIVFSGLTLTGRIEVADRAIVGYATMVIAIAMIVVHITRQFRKAN